MSDIADSAQDCIERCIKSMQTDAYVKGLRAENAFLGTLKWTENEIKVYNRRLLDIQYRLDMLRVWRLYRK